MVAYQEIRHGRHCVFNLHVHLVFVAKYRRLVFDKPALDTVKGIFSAICAKFEAHYGGDGRRARPRTPAGGIPAQASGFGAGEQPQRSLQPGLKTPAARHSQEILAGGALVSLILCRILRWRAHQHDSAIHRTTENTRLGELALAALSFRALNGGACRAAWSY